MPIRSPIGPPRRGVARGTVIAVAMALVWTSVAGAIPVVDASLGTQPAATAAPDAKGPPPGRFVPATPVPTVPHDSGGPAPIAVGVRPTPNGQGAKPPATPTEVPGLRGEHSRVIAKPDGTFDLQISNTRLNYLDAMGAYQPVDLSLVSDESGPFDLRIKALDRTVRLSDANADDALASIAAGPYAIRLRSFGYADQGGRTDGLVSFPGSTQDGTLTVQPTDTGFEWGITLPDPNRSPTYHFALDLGGLTARAASDGQTIILEDPTGDWAEGMPSPSIVATSRRPPCSTPTRPRPPTGR